MKTKYLLVLWVAFSALDVFGQGEGNWWFFGQNGGLSFTTSPPTSVTGSLVTQEGCSSISDASGNLLMYTDGLTVYTKTHSVMANGTGLGGNASTAQSGVIVKQPGSTSMFYIFTMGVSNNGNLQYSVVDMSLAAGAGSVITKNTYLYGPCLEKLTAVKHSNNQDVWVLVHENGSSINFRAYLLTSAGVSTTAVISSVGGSGTSQSIGYLRASPNGQYVASGYYAAPGGVELYNFNTSTGVLSNPVFLPTINTNYGVEFSPDGTKLYGSGLGRISQWSICAGSATAIAASHYSFSATSNWALQLGPDGKIYVSRYLTTSLGVIHNPNAAGSNLNYVDQGLSISPNICRLGLPNYCTSWFMPPPSQFTVTIGTPTNAIGCLSASFTSPPTGSMSLPGCAALTTSLTGLQWNFGDPASGSANTTNAPHPIHMFSGLGSFTVSLILSYSNGGGTDTIQQVVNITQPCITVSSTSITCASLGSATVAAVGGIGPFSYTWMPGNQLGTVATGLSPGSYTISVYDQGNNYTYTAQTIFVSLVPLTGVSSTQASLTCFGASNGTATVGNFAGGSGNQNFAWTNGVITFTPALVTTLSAGLWSVTVTDALTGCQVKEVFQITQPPQIQVTITPDSYTACAGTSISFTGSAAGGVGTYNYQWTAGPPGNTMVVSQAAGPFVYTLSATDNNSCTASNTISVNFIANPVLTLQNPSICPLQTGTITASGASSYTWTDNSTGPSFTASPMVTSGYSLIGSALGCTAAATGTIFLKPLPMAIAGSNSPKCNGQNLQLFATGGSTYRWEGPQSFTSAIQNPMLYFAAPGQSGAYQLTVTAANGCTASTGHTVIVHPTPSLAASSSTVCVPGPLNLFASSEQGATFKWYGPQSFYSTGQNPQRLNAGTAMSGNYQVIAASVAGCTISAFVHGSVVAMPVPSFTSNSPRCSGETLLLNAAATSGAASYLWAGPGGFNSATVSNTINPVSIVGAGIYSLTVTNGPCTATTSQAVVVHALPVPFLTSSSPVCEGKTLYLNANAPGFNVQQYLWSGPSGFSHGFPSPVLSGVNAAHAGMYSVQLTDIHGCRASGSVQVSVLENPVVTATGATVCVFNSATLSASGAASYEWSGPMLSVANGPEAVVGSAAFTEPQYYSVTGTAMNGCRAVAGASVFTRPLPVPVIGLKPDSVFCLNETATLSATGGENYQWLGPHNIQLAGQTVSLQLTAAAYAGEYTLVAGDAFGCYGRAVTFIQVNELPQGSLAGDIGGKCVPFCGDFSYAAPGTHSHISVSWEIERKKFNSKSFSYCFDQAGEYLVTGRFHDQNTQCDNVYNFYVQALEVPVADFRWTPEQPVEGGDAVVFINTSEGAQQSKWTWHFVNNNGGVKNQISSTYIFGEAGVYPVALIVENEAGCSDTIVKNISVEPDFTIYVPDAFTPDGDGVNDVFRPVVRGVKFYHFSVYNRWGELLLSTGDLEAGWDGFYNGREAKEDTYVWKVALTTLSGEPRDYHGSVLLLR